MSDVPDIQEIIAELDEGALLCVRILGGVSGALIADFGRSRVFQALDVLAHPDAQAVLGTMLQHTEGQIHNAAEEVVDAYRRTRKSE